MSTALVAQGAPLAALRECRQPFFLGDNRDIGRQCTQPGNNAAVRGKIRLRQGRSVTFLLNVEVGSVDFENCIAGVDREIDDRVDHFLEVHSIIRSHAGPRSIKQ